MRPKTSSRTVQVFEFCLIFTLGILSAWFAVEGLRTGEVQAPSKTGNSHLISGEISPIRYWLSIAIWLANYTVLVCLAGWKAIKYIASDRPPQR